MKGKYKIYLDGKLVAEQENIITNRGKSMILRHIAGTGSQFAGQIAVGIGGIAATANDDTLDFEILRLPIKSSSLDSDYQIVYKATLETEEEYQIKEIGIYPAELFRQRKNIYSQLLFDMDVTETWLKPNGDSAVVAKSSTYPNVRVGSTAVSVASGSTASAETVLDLSGYLDTDRFKMAVQRVSTNSTVTLEFYSGQTSKATFTGVLDSDYEILSFAKATASYTGTVDWSNITKIVISSNGGDIIVDGIRVDVTSEATPQFSLVSRSVFSTVQEKPKSVIMDIEYYLDIDF